MYEMKQKLPNDPKWYLDAQPRVLFLSSNDDTQSFY